MTPGPARRRRPRGHRARRRCCARSGSCRAGAWSRWSPRRWSTRARRGGGRERRARRCPRCSRAACRRALQRHRARARRRDGARAPGRAAGARRSSRARATATLSASVVAAPARQATCCPRSRPARPARSGSRAGTTAPARTPRCASSPTCTTARRLALAVARGRFRDQGATARGPLGLGTEFELIRDYEPDDDIRQVNWRATARLGRPMSNQYRLEQDRDLLLLIDAGRLSAAPLGATARRSSTPALDAAAALAFVADELGDRTGAVAFDDEVRAALPPRRAGGQPVVRALFDLEPRPVDSDYELAFRRAEGSKRALVVVFCDLLEEAAARPLVARRPGAHAPPRGGRRQPVGPGAGGARRGAGGGDADPLGRRAGDGRRRRAAARARAAAQVRAAGARVLEAPPDRLPACSSPPTCGQGARGALSGTRPRHAHEPPEQHEQREPERRLDHDRQLRPGREALQEAAQHEPRRPSPPPARPRAAPRAAARSRAAAARAGSAPSPSAARRCRRRRCTRSPAARARRSAAGTRRRCRRRSPARRSCPASAR